MNESEEKKESKAVDIEFVFGDETKAAEQAARKQRSTGAGESSVDLASAPAEPPSGFGAESSADADSLDNPQLEAELNRYKETALRAVADLDNYRKRMTREKEETTRYANFSFLERLIPILDNFELGLQAAKTDSGRSGILDGMNMVFKQLQDFLASCGVETIDATGQPFDPKLHEAIAQEESKEFAEGIVIRQLRKGYKLKDRLIRPANVVVSKGMPTAKKAEANANR
jgi:molecular chaperone GrpE